MAIHRNKRFGGGRKAGSAPRGAFRGRASPSEKYVLPSEDCAQKKVTGPVALECISGPVSPKILRHGDPNDGLKTCKIFILCARVEGISRS